jgi:hypothetical protein
MLFTVLFSIMTACSNLGLLKIQTRCRIPETGKNRQLHARLPSSVPEISAEFGKRRFLAQ